MTWQKEGQKGISGACDVVKVGGREESERELPGGVVEQWWKLQQKAG